MDERKFDEFLERLFKLESAVQRLTEHESLDRSRRDERYKNIIDRLIELEKMRLETANGRLRSLENRPVIVQLTEKEIKGFFDQWGEILAGKLSFRFILSVAGALGVILTAIVTAAFIAYFKFR
jgi:hypothetical protein